MYFSKKSTPISFVNEKKIKIKKTIDKKLSNRKLLNIKPVNERHCIYTNVPGLFQRSMGSTSKFQIGNCVLLHISGKVFLRQKF